MEAITKRFPGVLANDRVSLSVQAGTFHAVIGENGAGKSTLLNVLYGRYRPDSGRIWLADEDVTGKMHSPADAIRRGVGLVSQHFALIPALSVVENIVLGAEPHGPGGFLRIRDARDQIGALTERLRLEDLDLSARADRVSVAVGQKIEIVKALYRGARILLLDEPTATLAPQEADSLFALLGTLLSNGTTIVFVTHKLREVMTYSQNVTVLRGGRNAGDFTTAATSPEELLSRMIVAREPVPAGAPAEAGGPEIRTITASPAADIDPPRGPGGTDAGGDATRPPLLTIDGVSVRGRRAALSVRDATIDVAAGEIVGIAGVDGSGQRELAEAIVGLRPAESGEIRLRADGLAEPVVLNHRSVRDRQRLGVAYIPEDRHRTALALDFTVAENYLLGHEDQKDWGGGAVLNRARMKARAGAMIVANDVRMGERDADVPARALSGGNQQKVVIARALDGAPRLLVACQPTRGLDVEAARFVYRSLRAAKAKGLAILLFSLDLDEILELSDRVAVMYNGQVVGVVPRKQAAAESIGALMTGAAGPRVGVAAQA